MYMFYDSLPTMIDQNMQPSFFCIHFFSFQIVMILLENCVQVNPCDKRGNTPLHFCCNNGHMDSAKLLMIVSTCSSFYR